MKQIFKDIVVNTNEDILEVSSKEKGFKVVFDRGYKGNNVFAFVNKDRFIIKDYQTLLAMKQELLSYEVVFSHFLLNLKTNKLTDLLSLSITAFEDITQREYESDSFVRVFDEEVKNKKLDIVSFKNGKKIITANGAPVIEMMDNKLIRINFTKAKEVPASFLFLDNDLDEANFSNALKISDNAFFNNENMKILNVPKVKYIGDFVLYNNKAMEKCYLPSAIYIGSKFLNENDDKKIFISGKIENFNDVLFKLQEKSR